MSVCARLSRSSSPGRYFSRKEGERERGEALESPATSAPQPSSPSASPPGAAAASRVSGAGARARRPERAPALCARAGREGARALGARSAGQAGGRAGCVRPTPRGPAVLGSRCSSGFLKGWGLEVSFATCMAPASASPSPSALPPPLPLCP